MHVDIKTNGIPNCTEYLMKKDPFSQKVISFLFSLVIFFSSHSKGAYFRLNKLSYLLSPHINFIFIAEMFFSLVPASLADAVPHHKKASFISLCLLL